jgi:Putative transposase/Transposase zinc-binding domain
MDVTLQAILQTAFPSFAHAHRQPPRVWRAAHAVMRCRTAALGGYVRRCPAGPVAALAYNACRHRACPRCGRHRLGQWLDGWQQSLLPTTHFHVIFTLPSELHALWRWNRLVLTELLFRAVRETLLTLLADPRWLGAQPGILAALHTWGRTLTLHPHVHCLVTGGGRDSAGTWRPVRTGFLLPVAVLRTLFAGKVLGGIEALGTAGQLVLPPDLPEAGLRRLLRAAARRKWNLCIPDRYAHGRGVVKYLARYVRGGPIKDSRLVAFDGQHVTFRYGNHRDLDAAGHPRQDDLTLSVQDFLGRWSEHVALPGVHTVRAWGLYAATQRARLTRCRAQLPPPPPDTAPEATHTQPYPDHPRHRCPVCHQALVVTRVGARAGTPPQGPALSLAAYRPPQIPIGGAPLHVQQAVQAGNGPGAPAHATPPGWPVAA